MTEGYCMDVKGKKDMIEFCKGMYIFDEVLKNEFMKGNRKQTNGKKKNEVIINSMKSKTKEI